jgi:hypothetical protein
LTWVRRRNGEGAMNVVIESLGAEAADYYRLLEGGTT